MSTNLSLPTSNAAKGTNDANQYTSLAFSPGSAIAAGKTLLVRFHLRGPVGASISISDTQGNTWIQDFGLSSTMSLYVFRCQSTAAMATTDTITISWTTSGFYPTACLDVVNAGGLTPVTPLDQSTSATAGINNATTYTVSLGTLGQAVELLYIASPQGQLGSPTVTSGYTNLGIGDSANNETLFGWAQVTSVSTAPSFTATWTTAAPYSVAMIAYRALVTDDGSGAVAGTDSFSGSGVENSPAANQTSAAVATVTTAGITTSEYAATIAGGSGATVILGVQVEYIATITAGSQVAPQLSGETPFVATVTGSSLFAPAITDTSGDDAAPMTIGMTWVGGGLFVLGGAGILSETETWAATSHVAYHATGSIVEGTTWTGTAGIIEQEGGTLTEAMTWTGAGANTYHQGGSLVESMTWTADSEDFKTGVTTRALSAQAIVAGSSWAAPGSVKSIGNLDARGMGGSIHLTIRPTIHLTVRTNGWLGTHTAGLFGIDTLDGALWPVDASGTPLPLLELSLTLSGPYLEIDVPVGEEDQLMLPPNPQQIAVVPGAVSIFAGDTLPAFRFYIFNIVPGLPRRPLVGSTVICKLRRQGSRFNIFSGTQTQATIVDALGGVADYFLPQPINSPSAYDAQVSVVDASGKVVSSPIFTLNVLRSL